MPDSEMYYLFLTMSCVFIIFYAFSAFLLKLNEDSETAEDMVGSASFVTNSIGILWPISGALLVCSFVFEAVAHSQGVVVLEAGQVRGVILTYTGLLTVLFISPIFGLLIGSKCGSSSFVQEHFANRKCLILEFRKIIKRI